MTESANRMMGSEPIKIVIVANFIISLIFGYVIPAASYMI